MDKLMTKDFFISYTSADRKWAEWIGWHLEEAGYTVFMQAWDFRPGQSFVRNMQQGANCKRTIAVLSPAYFKSEFTASEWETAFADDPTGEKGILLPVRIQKFAVPGMLKRIAYIDLVNIEESQAREVLLAGITGSRAKPQKAPAFPGEAVREVKAKPIFNELPTETQPLSKKRSFIQKDTNKKPGSKRIDLTKLKAWTKEPPTVHLRTTPSNSLDFEAIKKMLDEYGFYCSNEGNLSGPFTNPTGTGLRSGLGAKNGIVEVHGSGLMWQQQGSAEWMEYPAISTYINDLNISEFGGFSDWRLPTLEEGMSLVQPKKSENGLFISSFFNSTQLWIWTTDGAHEDWSWNVDFETGSYDQYNRNGGISFVRAVRSVLTIGADK
ncbi:MAG: TIR domain-containing protein [Calditrichia bacterium]